MFSYNAFFIKARLKENEKILIENLSFSLNRGEKLALVGETGSGKTITALSIMGLLPSNVYAELKISLSINNERTLTGNDVYKALGSEVVYIPQNGLEALSSIRTVRKHLYDSLKKNGCNRKDLEEKSLENLTKAGFNNAKEIIDLYPFELSGGMAQRVTIALALSQNPKLIIADEPTNGLDSENKEKFISLIDSIPAAKIVITHDISLCAKMDKIIVLKDGFVMEKGDKQDVLERTKCEYTKALINSLIENGMKETPHLRDKIDCCPFYDRCESAKQECLNVKIKAQGNHFWRCIND